MPKRNQLAISFEFQSKAAKKIPFLTLGAYHKCVLTLHFDSAPNINMYKIEQGDLWRLHTARRGLTALLVLPAIQYGVCCL